MKKKFKSVYQFKITLKDIKPPIWRRIQVPESYTFWDLHVAIQDVMGWLDYHLHLFGIINPSTELKDEIGIPYEDFEFDKETLPGWELKIADYFSMENPKADYLYDFGDGWEHVIELEKIVARAKDVKYPVCVTGKRSCPPEDCGGIWGYQDFLEIIKNPDDEEYEEMLRWVGGEFDPEAFNIEDVHFDDPDKRWKTAFR
ncbi:MAG: plasmid pRiA4b ORF-3 family protein [Syntrophales bacterium]|nr:plasmid pRiA4b ORF-3 family protein [Syntrophales bacterium]